MKLRINHSSIRIRLSKSDTESLSKEGVISDVLVFPGGEKFICTLQIASSFGAEMNEGGWIITIPEEQADDWLKSEKLSLEAKIPRSGMKNLILLVEKDLHDL